MIPSRLKFILDRDLTVSNLLDKAVEAHGSRILFTSDEDLGHYCAPHDGITAHRLRDIVNRLTNVYIGHGIEAFERVAVWKANSLDYFFHSLAAMRLGGIAVPINGGMPVESLIRYTDHTGCVALVTDSARLARIAASGQNLPGSIRTIFVTDAEPAPSWQGPIPVVPITGLMRASSSTYDAPFMDHDQDVLICHTSGTTGFPKGVLHCSRSLALAAKAQLRVQFVSARNTAMTAAWMNHHIALSGCFTSVVAGMHVHCMVDHDPEHLLQAIERERANIFFAFPDVYQRMCRAGLERFDLSSMKMWMSGGDAMHEVHIRQLVRNGAFLRLFGRRIVSSVFCELLGTSEVGMVALMKMSTARTSRYGRCVGRRTPVSPQVKVADRIGREVTAGEVGRLMVKGPTVFKGYWNRHDMLHDVVRDGWWWTGDLAFRDARGRIYQIDRAVDMVQTDEGPVYGLLVEEEALKLPGVVEAAVIRAEDEKGRDRAVLILQIERGAPFDAEATLAAIRTRSEYGGRISEVSVVDCDEEIPRGLTGKVLKRALRERVPIRNAA